MLTRIMMAVETVGKNASDDDEDEDEEEDGDDEVLGRHTDVE